MCRDKRRITRLLWRQQSRPVRRTTRPRSCDVCGCRVRTHVRGDGEGPTHLLRRQPRRPVRCAFGLGPRGFGCGRQSPYLRLAPGWPGSVLRTLGSPVVPFSGFRGLGGLGLVLCLLVQGALVKKPTPKKGPLVKI